ncbi:BON domain-containing protein [uncultured Phenylobacterium sp.]|uniref:BON domain-containing protein n=1 Tax=uncultured Phenylobacterium sp. TaxID=349273 RepID=UPI0025FB73EC|nr:BON domain-containing protein [uncultured Phenylobacterium sp.]
MAGRWSDEWRPEGNHDRLERERERFDGAEDRSFERGRDRVFGERETGVGYNLPRSAQPGGGYRTDYRSRADSRSRGDQPAWQDRNYQGVSPGFRQHERDYENEHRGASRVPNQDYTRGGRYYGDDGRGRPYREETGYSRPQDYDQAPRFGSREADERWRREMRGGGAYAGGVDAYYDHDRDYGDGGRSESFEDRARDAGDFFRRTGRKVANWFSDVRDDVRDAGSDYERAHRGRGPKGYKRSDARIDEEVHERLTDDPWLDASEIGVSVSNGEVTLTGTVESREAKHRAERIVEDLSGVNHVQNNIRVRQAGSYSTSGRGGGYGEGAVRSEGEASMETSANATHTTTRKS